ncbi:MAG: retropepsin-like aspartic protease [Leptolyngbyaceae cyanobacterium]
MNYLEHPYDPGRVSPRLSLDFVIENPQVEGMSKPCRGILDTGSEVTFIPEDCLLRLGLSTIGSPAEIRGLGGVKKYYPYAAEIGFDGNPNKLVEVYGWQYNYALLGMDWLEEYCVQLDGPCGAFRFMESRCDSSEEE